jgi:NADH dehydrogenase [ubiquinone] 1 alpha subcomplex assembly factor 5
MYFGTKNFKTLRVQSRLTRQSHFSDVVFDRDLKFRQRNWSYQVTKTQSESDYYDYIRKEITERLADRLDDISRIFPLALEIDARRDYFRNILENSHTERNGNTIGGIESLIQTTSIPSSIKINQNPILINDSIRIQQVVCNEENLLFPNESFDMILCPFALHWVNNIPGVLQKFKSILKKDGVFLGAMLGGSTLEELRNCFYLADMERKGGVGPHASPFALPSDVAGLMQNAGFTLPTIDVDTITVNKFRFNCFF